MRIFTTIFAVLVLSSVAGCAAQNTASRGSDTAVRAETRRISNARSYPAQDVVSVPMSDSERVRRF
jgi:hypothetical protein